MTSANTATSSPARAASKRWPWGWIGFVTLMTVGAGAAFFYFQAKGANAAIGRETTDADTGSDVTEEPASVEVVRLAKGGIARAAKQIGSVQPYKEADLYAKISGYLQTLNVDYGDHVKEGQVLAVIDDPELAKAVEFAQAKLRQSRAAERQAVAQIATAEAAVKAVKAQVALAKADVEKAASTLSYRKKQYARITSLAQKDAIEQKLVDEEVDLYESSVAAHHASLAQELKAEADVVEAEAKVTQAKADRDEAEANVSVAETELAKAQVLFNYTKIVSPYTGVVTARNFFPGAFIRSAADGAAVPLLTVARTDLVRVVTFVPDRDVPYTDVGDEAEVTIMALPGKVFAGKVSRFAEREDPTSRTMHTEIDLKNSDDILRPGMSGIAKIIVDHATKNSTLPASCLAGESRGGKADIYIVKDGKAQKTQVTIGEDDGIRVEILTGITPEDEVILNPSLVSQGAPVHAMPAHPRSAPEAAPAQAAAHEGQVHGS